MGSFEEYIKSFDQYGYNIALNFNKSGTTHNTLTGGITSLIVTIIMALISIFNLQSMIFY